jgi:hypothetical protein
MSNAYFTTIRFAHSCLAEVVKFFPTQHVVTGTRGEVGA